jgi:GMP synthase (glutamine-hydrolysing)
MISIISTCKEKLHDLEFVEPVKEVVRKEGKKFFEVRYNKLTEKDIEKADKIIICGTSLKDNDFLKEIKRFSRLKETNKPILGICAGMQIINLVYSENRFAPPSHHHPQISKKTEIGFFKENFEKEFLELKGEQEVWHLHNNYINFNDNFESFCLNNIPQAVKHKEKDIYGVLFHPEVRNKDLIREFLRR